MAGLVLALVVVLWPTNPSDEQVRTLQTELLRHASELNSDYVVLIDYDRPIYKKRLWLLHLPTGEVLLNAHVSHASKSGLLYAREFSNEPGSQISCKGSFKTLGTYESQYGKGVYKIGMQIQGLQPGENDNSYQRSITFHSNWWPWSQGCFMTLPWVNKKVIDFTKNGSLVLVL